MLAYKSILSIQKGTPFTSLFPTTNLLNENGRYHFHTWPFNRLSLRALNGSLNMTSCSAGLKSIEFKTGTERHRAEKDVSRGNEGKGGQANRWYFGEAMGNWGKKLYIS